MKQLVYIAGRGHSGSTLLDLMLSGHPRFIGVGEVCSLFDPTRNFLYHPTDVECSCGNTIDQCEFWAPTINVLRPAYDRKADAQELYRLFLDEFYKHFGSDAIPVDISKTDENLGIIKLMENVNIKVIFLIRDVRSWTVSMRDVARRADDFKVSSLIQKYGWRAWKPYVGRMSTKFFLHWHILNRRTQRFLRKNNLPTFQVGYEELCLYPEMLMRQLSVFLEVEYCESMLSLKDTQSHVILGNRMRSQEEKRRGVVYDDRWFYNNDWMLPTLIFPHIMRYNSAEVYHNIQGKLWDA